MSKTQGRPQVPDPPEYGRSLRRWDRQLVWWSGIGFSTLAWTAVALAVLHSL